MAGWRLSAALALLSLGTGVLYAGALGHDFVRYWDDSTYIHDNPGVAQLDWHHVLTAPVASTYHPLTVASLAVEFAAFGQTPTVFHLTNVVLHILNSVLVVVLLQRLLGGHPFVPLLVGALFAVHPLHVESVAWISGRKDVLSTFCYLAALLAYLRFCRTHGAAAYAGTFLLAVLALLSKPMAVTLPAAMLLIDYRDRRQPLLRVILEKLPFGALSVAAVIVNDAVRSGPLAMQPPGADADALEIARIGGQSLVFYVSKSFAPLDLSIIYDAGLVTIETYQYAIASLAALASLLLLVRGGESRRNQLWALLFFLVTIAPVLKIIPFGGRSIFNDRYMYLPSIGLFAVFALPFRNCWHWAPARRFAAVALWSGALVALSILSVDRIAVWRNSETLFRDVVEQFPDSAIAWNQLGLYYLEEQGEIDAAQSSFQRAIDAQPGFNLPYLHLARIQIRRGEQAKAIRLLDKAIQAEPDDLATVHRIAVIHQRAGRFERAVELYDRVLARQPRLLEAHHNRGLAALRLGDREGAERSLLRAIEIDPTRPDSYRSLAAMYESQGERDRAQRLLDRARRHGVAIDPPPR